MSALHEIVGRHGSTRIESAPSSAAASGGAAAAAVTSGKRKRLADAFIGTAGVMPSHSFRPCDREASSLRRHGIPHLSGALGYRARSGLGSLSYAVRSGWLSHHSANTATTRSLIVPGG